MVRRAMGFRASAGDRFGRIVCCPARPDCRLLQQEFAPPASMIVVGLVPLIARTWRTWCCRAPMRGGADGDPLAIGGGRARLVQQPLVESAAGGDRRSARSAAALGEQALVSFATQRAGFALTLGIVARARVHHHRVAADRVCCPGLAPARRDATRSASACEHPRSATGGRRRRQGADRAAGAAPADPAGRRGGPFATLQNLGTWIRFHPIMC